MSLRSWFETTAQDLRFALRSLGRQRGLCAVIVLTVALAVGANTAIFSLMDALMLRALPVRSPRQLVLLSWTAHKQPNFQSISTYGDCTTRFTDVDPESCSFSATFFQDLARTSHSFAELTASGGTSQYDLSGHGAPSIANGQMVAGNYFQVLGLAPARGRLLLPSDDTATAPPVMVLSYRYWQAAFAGDAGVVGQTISLNNVPVTIVGVAPESFSGLTPGSEYDGWLPLAANRRLNPNWSPRNKEATSLWLVLLGRLRPGVSLAAAQAETSGLFRASLLAGAKPLSKAADNPRILLNDAQSGLVGARRRYLQPFTVLAWTVAAILLIACANIAGLLVGRAHARSKELALRRALGAGRARIARQLLTECLLLAGAGGIIGVGLAIIGARTLLDLFTGGGGGNGNLAQPPLNVAPDWRVLGFALTITVATGLLFGLAPALRGARTDLNSALKDGVGNSEPAARGPLRWLHLGNLLTTAQVALCMVVLAAAGLLVRTLSDLRAVNPGFDARNVLIFNLAPALIGYKGAAVIRLDDTLQQRLSALPGVLAASYSANPLLSGGWSQTTFKLNGKDVDTYTIGVSRNFIATMGMRFMLGTDLQPADFTPESGAPAAANAPPPPPTPVLVNQEFVRKYIGNRNPVGLTLGDPKDNAFLIRGVVSDAKYANLRDGIKPTVYAPHNWGYVTFELRTALPPLALLPAVRRTVAAVDNRLPIQRPTTEAATIDRLLQQERLMAKLSSFFAGLALLLTSIGLYGLLSQEVTRRTREIGIRMALGAERAHVLRLIAGLGLALGGCGLALGAAGAWGITRLLKDMLYGVSPTDPVTLAAVGALLLAVALAASLIPARRATRVDPLVALRYE
ncbi:MAG: ABC transporter permease [Terriglobales bacterium]